MLFWRATDVTQVIAVGGDVVQCCDVAGRAIVNGQPLREPHLFQDDHRDFVTVTVPAGELFVMGHHRSASADSWFRGTVTVGRVVGRAQLTAWPPTRIRRLH
ncbi:MAG: signal peptidase I [Pseudorhodobacter sp.]|nr:signal peptidase I [Frankiaceae bacterium]